MTGSYLNLAAQSKWSADSRDSDAEYAVALRSCTQNLAVVRFVCAVLHRAGMDLTVSCTTPALTNPGHMAAALSMCAARVSMSTSAAPLAFVLSVYDINGTWLGMHNWTLQFQVCGARIEEAAKWTRCGAVITAVLAGQR